MADMTRREFVRSAGSAAAAASVLSLAPAAVRAAGGAARRRYAVVGTGVRAIGMWGGEIAKQYGDILDVVGLCDINPKRVEVAKKKMGVDCPTFTDFDTMCEKAKPDLLMVTTVDAFHADYVVKALDRGMDAMTEKPMVTDEKQCQAILDAEKRNKRDIVVTFNYRFTPEHIKIKELLMSGEIGAVTSVDFNWYLDIDHGASYFRRWHAYKGKSGSLWVHKATHHFDLANWWLDADPVEVTAHGELKHYGKSGPFHHTHCRTCSHKGDCRYFWDITKDRWSMDLYVACESEDGYRRDGCVYREDIDTYDTMSALIRYSNGATMTYSLNASMPYEGYRISFNGLQGRLDVCFHGMAPANGIWLTKKFERPQKIEVKAGAGGHGGGDDYLRDLIFRKPEAPAHLRAAGSRAGAMSCLIGIAARNSIEQKRTIRIGDLVKFG